MLHVRGEAGYAEAPESRAFSGWKAGEIFRALTEEDWSAQTVCAVLRARGIEAALDSPEDRKLIGALPAQTLIAVALACSGEADFRRRVREQLGPPTEVAP